MNNKICPVLMSVCTNLAVLALSINIYRKTITDKLLQIVTQVTTVPILAAWFDNKNHDSLY